MMLSVEEVGEQTRGLARELDLSQEVQDDAAGYAERAFIEHPIGRAPSSVIAASVYLAAFMNNEKRTQATVSRAANVSRVAIRETYHEISEHEPSVPTFAEGSREAANREREQGRFKRAREFLTGGGR